MLKIKKSLSEQGVGLNRTIEILDLVYRYTTSKKI